jgi:ketosteroid isomerase-like protein
MKPQTQARVGEVEQVVGRLEAAFNARDPAAMATLYAEDALLMPPNDMPVQGSEAIQAWFEQALPLGAIRLGPTATRVGGAAGLERWRAYRQVRSRADSSGSTVGNLG